MSTFATRARQDARRLSKQPARAGLGAVVTSLSARRAACPTCPKLPPREARHG